MFAEDHPSLWDGLRKLKGPTIVVVVVVVQAEQEVPLKKKGEFKMMSPLHTGVDHHPVTIYSQYDTEKDFDSITTTSEELSKCCFYYGGLTSMDAKAILRNSVVGTYLVRDSSDPKYLYSLSLKTERGTTSVRIEYSRGTFRLDCEDKLRSKMPTFMSVLKLIEYYVNLSQSKESKQCRWLESSGRRDVPVRLTKPCIGTVQSLQHLARLTINNNTPIEKLDDIGLPKKLTNYLRDYPYHN